MDIHLFKAIAHSGQGSGNRSRPQKGNKIKFKSIHSRNMAVKHVVYKGRQYEVNSLSEEARKLMTLMKVSNDQITRAQAEITIAEAGRAVLTAKLDEQLKNVSSEAAPEGEG